MQLIKDGKTISTLDLFEKEYVLLVGSDGYAWQAAANELVTTQLLPLKNYRISEDGDFVDSENEWYKVYEMTITGAVLIRPDGHVVWRSDKMVDNLIDTLTEIFRIFY